MLPVNQVEDAKRMLATGEYQLPRSKVCEDLWFIRYLLNKKKSEEEIFELWKPIFLSRERNKDSCFNVEQYFKQCLKKARKHPIIHQRKYSVYASEIEAINEYDVPIRLKQLAVVILCYFKALGKHYVYQEELLKYEHSFQSLLTEGKTKLKETRKDTFKCIEHGLICRQNITHFDDIMGDEIEIPIYVIPYLVQSGDAVFSSNTLADVQELFPMLKTERICEICGSKYVVNSKTKRTICEKCQKEKRRQLSREIMRRKAKK